jgi:hypothetical protein
MDWLPPIYIICNPHYEQKRFQFLREHLNKRGIPSEKITCVFGPWGSEVTSDEIFKVYDPFQKRFGCEIGLSFKSAHLSKGEISLNMTFFNILLTIFKEQKSESILVFESDVILREDFLERLKNILEEAKEREWDYISLGEGVGTRPQDVERLSSYYSPSKLYKPNNQWVFRCTDSMLLRVSFLKKIITTFLPFRECLDWELNFQWVLHEGKTLWVDPPLVEPGSGRGRTCTNLPA